MAAYRQVYDSCHLQANCQEPKNRDQLRNPTLGSRVWATFTFLPLEVFLNDMRYINPRFTYLLTYLP